MATHINKHLATARIGLELQQRGWTIFGYKTDTSDSMSDYYNPASWEGIATHPQMPGVVACVSVAKYDVEHRSGKDQLDVSYVPGAACAQCAGTGVEPNALHYAQAVQQPDEAHKIKADRAKGFRTFVYGGGSPVHRSDYDEDGQPKCMECHGRGHALERVEQVLFTWPTFQANPRGKSWHVEIGGSVKASGVGLSYCDGYQSGWERSVKRFVDDIETATRRAVEAHQRSATAVATGNTELAATTATRRDWTVQVEYEAGAGGTISSIVTTTPRMPKPTYYAFLPRFSAYYSRREQKLRVSRRVEAQEILDWLAPPTAADAAPVQQVAAQPRQETKTTSLEVSTSGTDLSLAPLNGQSNELAETVIAAPAIEDEAQAAPQGDLQVETQPLTYLIVLLPYDRDLLTPNAKPLATCGDFEIISVVASEIDALYERMNVESKALSYSEEFNSFEDAIAKAQRSTYRRANLASLTRGRGAVIKQYNAETDAAPVAFYAESTTRAKTEATAEVQAPVEQPVQNAEDALAELVYSISNLSSGTIGSIAGLSNYSEIEQYQEDFAAWVKANPAEAGETWQGAWKRYTEYLNTPTPDTRWLVALADAGDYLGFGARWDGEALGRWRLIRVEQLHLSWVQHRLASGLKGGRQAYTNRDEAQQEMEAHHELDTPVPAPVVEVAQPEPVTETVVVMQPQPESFNTIEVKPRRGQTNAPKLVQYSMF